MEPASPAEVIDLDLYKSLEPILIARKLTGEGPQAETLLSLYREVVAGNNGEENKTD